MPKGQMKRQVAQIWKKEGQPNGSQTVPTQNYLGGTKMAEVAGGLLILQLLHSGFRDFPSPTRGHAQKAASHSQIAWNPNAATRRVLHAAAMTTSNVLISMLRSSTT